MFSSVAKLSKNMAAKITFPSYLEANADKTLYGDNLLLYYRPIFSKDLHKTVQLSACFA